MWDFVSILLDFCAVRRTPALPQRESLSREISMSHFCVGLVLFVFVGEVAALHVVDVVAYAVHNLLA